MQCACGCQREVLSPRARYYSARCRLKVSQERNSPFLTSEQRRVLRRAEWWLRDYREFLLPVIREGGVSEEAAAAMDRQCEILQKLASEVGRIARGAGQLPLRLDSTRRAVRAARGDEITIGMRP